MLASCSVAMGKSLTASVSPPLTPRDDGHSRGQRELSRWPACTPTPPHARGPAGWHLPPPGRRGGPALLGSATPQEAAGRTLWEPGPQLRGVGSHSRRSPSQKQTGGQTTAVSQSPDPPRHASAARFPAIGCLLRGPPPNPASPNLPEDWLRDPWSSAYSVPDFTRIGRRSRDPPPAPPQPPQGLAAGAAAVCPALQSCLRVSAPRGRGSLCLGTCAAGRVRAAAAAGAGPTWVPGLPLRRLSTGNHVCRPSIQGPWKASGGRTLTAVPSIASPA